MVLLLSILKLFRSDGVSLGNDESGMDSNGMNRADALEAPPEVIDLEERSWLPRHCQGDDRAFPEFMAAYQTMVYTFLKRYGIDLDRRDDLFQDIFLKLHQAASGYDPGQPLRPWVVSIVLNTVRNHRRDRGRHLRVVEYGETPDRPGAAPDAQQAAEDSQMADFLETRLRDLPATQREVLALSTFKGLTMKEIAEVTGRPENTVKTHLRRARMALAEALVDRQEVRS